MRHVILQGIIYLTGICLFLVYFRYIDYKKVKKFKTKSNIILNSNFSDMINTKKYSEVTGFLAQKIKQLQERLKKFIFDVHMASSQVKSVSDQLAVSLKKNETLGVKAHKRVKKLDKLNEKSLNQMQETVNQMDQLTTIFDSMNNINQKIDELSKNTEKVIAENKDEILTVSNLLQGIKKSTNESLAKIKSLNEVAEEIGKILQITSDISRKIKILSLNASIESVRAGNSGKGFNVIAQEIDSLATRSKEEADEIDNLLTRMNQEVAAVSKTVANNIEDIKEVAGYSQKLNKSMNDIQESYLILQEEIKNNNQLIDREYHIVNQVDELINEMENITSEIDDNCIEIEQAINSQNENNKKILELGDRLEESSSVLFEQTEGDIESLIDMDSKEMKEIVQDTVQLLKENLKNKLGIKELDSGAHQKFLDQFLENNAPVEAVWSNNY